MRVIDFIALGADNLVYVIRDKDSSEILWRGTLRDFIWELTIFFMFYHKIVQRFDIEGPDLVFLYI